jgi:L-2-hydroxyglutarate oxidase LhgO
MKESTSSVINDQPIHVYNAPSAMPKLTSKLTQNKIKNNLINSNITEYDKWVSNLQLNKNNEIWLNKGNDVNYNYSACNFNGVIYKESDRPKIFNNDNITTTSTTNDITYNVDDNNDINDYGRNSYNTVTKCRFNGQTFRVI